MANRHKVTLTQAERTQLTELTHGGKSPEEAKAYLEAMRKAKRYQRDVY